MATLTPAQSPPPDEVPAELSSLKADLEASRTDLEASQLRPVADPLTRLGEHFRDLKSMLWQLASFFQGALEYPNQITFIGEAVRLAHRALLDEVFGTDGLVESAKERLEKPEDLASVKALQDHIKSLQRGSYRELDDALSSAGKVALAYWEWTVGHPKADAVQTNRQQQLHVTATGKVKQCLFTYSIEFGEAVDMLLGVLPLVQSPPPAAQ